MSCTNLYSLKKMNNKIGEKFSEFLRNWLCELDVYLQQLMIVISKQNVVVSDQELQALVSKVTQHYKQYYTVKWALAKEDVLAFFSPIWATPLENSYSWFTGWKPSTMFKLVKAGGGVLLSEEQMKKIEMLRVRVRFEEEKVEREMERNQVALAERKVVDIARVANRVKSDIENEGLGQVEGLMLKGVNGGLEKVMKGADCVRLRTLKGILDLLSPWQSVVFLAEVSMLQIRLKQWGLRNECSKKISADDDDDH